MKEKTEDHLEEEMEQIVKQTEGINRLEIMIEALLRGNSIIEIHGKVKAIKGFLLKKGKDLKINIQIQLEEAAPVLKGIE